ncbi:MAG: endolytic transglycosylase MltG, partial [Gemmatimonadota bacterium]
PTVVYALHERRRLYNKDYGLDSEYNTYRIHGLPPAPICQPNTASIMAALYPDASDYYYFVARSDGRHIFSRSYREHLATIREIRTRSSDNGR